MTFAEYNTDDNYDNKNGFESSLEELVKIGKSEGMTKDAIRSSLSPKWQKSSKLNKFDEYYGEETKPTEEKVTEKVIENTDPKTSEKLDKETEKFMDKNNAIQNAQEDNEYERQKAELFKRWDAREENINKMTDSMRRIDDHMIDQLPTFMFKRYSNGEFGDPKSSDAKLRLAHFMINGLGTALSNMSHVIRKDGVQEQSDAEKYQQTNLEQGLQNRWNKYKQETQSAIDLAKQGGMSEESITDSIATISSNNRLQSAFNQMNERQKVFALQVLGEIGNRMGNMNDAEFANTLFGMSAMGDSLDYKEAAGMLVYRFIKDPEKRDAALSELGLLNGGGTNVIAGIGGSLLGGNSGTEGETGTTLEDGTKIDPGKYMNSKEYKELVAAGDKLSQQYYNGEIDEAKFRSEYAKLEKIMSEHGWFSFFRNKGITSADDLIKVNNRNNLIQLSDEFDELNNNAKNYTKDEYLKKYDELKARGVKWGISEKDLKSVEKAKDKALKKTKK
jgi:hypothetical protein